MSNEKRKIIIEISDLDNMQVVLKALDNLFKIIITYYLEKDDICSFNKLVFSVS